MSRYTYSIKHIPTNDLIYMSRWFDSDESTITSKAAQSREIIRFLQFFADFFCTDHTSLDSVVFYLRCGMKFREDSQHFVLVETTNKAVLSNLIKNHEFLYQVLQDLSINNSLYSDRMEQLDDLIARYAIVRDDYSTEKRFERALSKISSNVRELAASLLPLPEEFVIIRC